MVAYSSSSGNDTHLGQLSSSGSQHVRLPAGVRDQVGDEISCLDRVIEAHADAARAYALCRVRTPHLGFASTFRIANSAAGDRVLEFSDRAGRALMVAPDSTQSILRLHCAARNQATTTGRYAFQSPIFRYRHGLRRREFHHIGFAIVDGASPADSDLVLVDLTIALCQMLQKLGEDVAVQLSDVGSVRRLCAEAGIAADEVGNFLRRMHRLERSVREATIASLLPSGEPRSRLIAALVPSATADDDALTSTSLANTAQLIKQHAQVPVRVDSGDLHGCETLDGIGMRVIAADGVSLGDGGAYGLLARRFHPSLVACHSVAIGLEFLADRLRSRAQQTGQQDAVLLLALDATTPFVAEAAMVLRAAGYGVACHAVKGSLKREMRRLPSGFGYVSVVGALEEGTRLLVLRSRSVGREFNVRVPLPSLATKFHQP